MPILNHPFKMEYLSLSYKTSYKTRASYKTHIDDTKPSMAWG